MTEMLDASSAPSEFADDIHENRWFFWVGGVLSIVFGVLAILMPYIATLAAELVIGAVLAMSGAVEAATAFKARRKTRIAMRFFLGLLSLAAGVLLLIDPLSGIFALTIVLTAFFLASGALKLYFAWKLHPEQGWGWMTFGGILTMGLGILVWSGLPGSAFWVLGLLVGIDLIFYGSTLIATVVVAQRYVEKNAKRPLSETP